MVAVVYTHGHGEDAASLVVAEQRREKKKPSPHSDSDGAAAATSRTTTRLLFHEELLVHHEQQHQPKKQKKRRSWTNKRVQFAANQTIHEVPNLDCYSPQEVHDLYLTRTEMSDMQQDIIRLVKSHLEQVKEREQQLENEKQQAEQVHQSSCAPTCSSSSISSTPVATSTTPANPTATSSSSSTKTSVEEQDSLRGLETYLLFLQHQRNPSHERSQSAVQAILGQQQETLTDTWLTKVYRPMYSHVAAAQARYRAKLDAQGSPPPYPQRIIMVRQ